MRGDRIVHTQLLMAQAFGALADVVTHARGYVLAEVTFAQLPAQPVKGTLACIVDSTVLTGVIPGGGGTNTVLAFYNGTNWKVVGA